MRLIAVVVELMRLKMTMDSDDERRVFTSHNVLFEGEVTLCHTSLLSRRRKGYRINDSGPVYDNWEAIRQLRKIPPEMRSGAVPMRKGRAVFGSL